MACTWPDLAVLAEVALESSAIQIQQDVPVWFAATARHPSGSLFFSRWLLVLNPPIALVGAEVSVVKSWPFVTASVSVLQGVRKQ